MQALGRHILLELYQCNIETLNEPARIESILIEATKASGATIVSHDFHAFNPYGVSGVIIIAESHVTIHTWPEYGYAAVDIFTCGESIDPWVIQDKIAADLGSESTSTMEMKRGLFKMPQGESIHHKPLQGAIESI